MADISVRESHSLPPAKAIKAVQTWELQMKKYGVKTQWKGQSAEVKGVGLSGSIEVTATEVVVDLKLGTLARMAGIDPVRLESSIRRRLKESLAG